MKLDSAIHAFITGGASGIGLAVARGLAARGARVTIADIDEAALAVVETGHAIRGTVLDVRDRVAWARAKEEAQDAFGPVDILFNNAGIASAGFELADMDPEVFDRVIAVNLTGVFNGISTFAADMRERRRGHIINTASMAGICMPSHGIGGNYAASKSAVVGLSLTLRTELAPHGVGVSVLCPGTVETGIVANSVRLGGGVRLPPQAIDQVHGQAGKTERAASPFEHGGPDALVPDLLRGIEEDAACIVYHGRGWWPLAEARNAMIEQAFAGAREQQ